MAGALTVTARATEREAQLLPRAELESRRTLAYCLAHAETAPPLALRTTSGHAMEGPRGLRALDWQALEHTDWKPVPKTLDPNEWHDHHPLPKADVVVMTWTSAEWDALHYVFANDLHPLPADPRDNKTWRAKWLPYRRDFYQVIDDLWLHRLTVERQFARAWRRGAPALNRSEMAWGRFCLVEVGGKRQPSRRKTVLLFKSALHLNSDGVSLPLRQLVRQIIEDARPDLLLSVGTAGGVRKEDGLGDAIVARQARFRLGDEFKTAAFNDQTYVSSWRPPIQALESASEYLMPVSEFPLDPPTLHYTGARRVVAKEACPQVKVVDDKPVITTDFFEFGTTENGLDAIGCCVEMDDAVVAMEAAVAGVTFGFVRNVSDPVINASLPPALQRAWAVATYRELGLYTSYNSAVATLAAIVGN